MSKVVLSTDPAALAQGEAMRRQMLLRRDRVLSRRTFPIYGLDDRWKGNRWFGGLSESNDGIGHIDLAHGDVRDISEPFVSVATHPFLRHRFGRASTPDGERHWLTATATRSLVEWLPVPDATRPPNNDPAPMRESPPPVEDWELVAFRIATHLWSFQRFAAGRTWVAVGAIDDVVLGVRARGVAVEEVHLSRIDDITPYLTNIPFP